MAKYYLLKQGIIYDGENAGYKGDILFSNYIEEIKPVIKNYPKETEIIDCSNRIIRPGGIDIHTHFNLIINENLKTIEDISDGTKGALYGGITTIGDFATQMPDENLIECYEKRYSEFKSKSLTNFIIHLAITNWNKDSFKEIKYLKEKYLLKSIKLFTTYKERNYHSNNGEILQALEKSKDMNYIVMVHSEDDDIIVYRKRNLPLYLSEMEKFCYIRPPISETAAVNNLCYLNHKANGNLYVVHISSGESVKIIEKYRKNNPSANFFAETCIQYLYFNDEVFKRKDGYLYTSTPQIKTEKDRQILLKSFLENKFDTLATDNCTFSSKEKEKGLIKGFQFIPVGLPGTRFLLEISFDLLVNRNGYSIHNWVYHTSSRQAEIFNIEKRGFLKKGYFADIVIFNPNKEWKIEKKDLITKADWSPYLGKKIKGKVIATFLSGKKKVFNDKFIGE